MGCTLEQIKKNYFRRIFSTSFNGQGPYTVIVTATFSLDEVRDIILEVSREFNIDNIIIEDYDYEKISNFFSNNPTEEEIMEFIPKYPVPRGNVAEIFFCNVTDESNEWYSPFGDEYYKYLERKNSEYYEIVHNLPSENSIGTVCPNRKWAKSLLGSEDKVDELWKIIDEVIPSQEALDEEAKIRDEIQRKLQAMNIRDLYFYTDLGTDFKISLTCHSLWKSSPSRINGTVNWENLPSYEIFTAPDCYSAEGKIVLSKKRLYYYDSIITMAEFGFSKGRMVECTTDCDTLIKTAIHKKSGLNRIGEIALVSSNSPLAQSDQYYGNTILDENTGCHFALGYCWRECIDIPEEILKRKGHRYYHFYESHFHQDFVFGNNSTMVEAKPSGSKNKILIMEKGIWRI